MTHDDDPEMLRPLVDRLPRSIEPPRDLWPAVEARLAHRARPPRRRFAALAIAAGVLIAVMSSLATAWLLRSNEPSQTAVVTAAPAPREAAYLRATASLSQELAMRRDQLAPETIAVLERNLAIIDRAIAESRAALAGDPGNADLAELLWASYERKVSLLEQASRIATPS